LIGIRFSKITVRKSGSIGGKPYLNVGESNDCNHGKR